MSNRFEIKIGEFEEENIVDNLNGEIICEISDMCEKMNKLHEQNKELQKEHEQLKQQLNYIQNSISEHIKHQKTELGQKALKEIIEEYNEWLLKDYR